MFLVLKAKSATLFTISVDIMHKYIAFDWIASSDNGGSIGKATGKSGY
jgi:hypothetical protein